MYKIPILPLKEDLESKAVLRQVARSHRRLAELKGAVLSIPKPDILINTLSLQEAKDSSAVESIITTHDELYRAELSFHTGISPAAKEVQYYSNALIYGFKRVKNQGLLTCNDIREIYKRIKLNDAGFRSTPGTALINDHTGEMVYQPPQDHAEIVSYMSNLEEFINDNAMSDLDPLVKMCVILVSQGLLEWPVLYLSRYIIKNKNEYYRLIQSVRDDGDWESWILFLLKGLEETSFETLSLIMNIKDLMMEYKQRIRSELPKVYSQDLLNNLFRHPYTKIDFVCNELAITRPTATSYLNQLVDNGFLRKMKLGKNNFYLNTRLFDLLLNAFHIEKPNGEQQQIRTSE